MNALIRSTSSALLTQGVRSAGSIAVRSGNIVSSTTQALINGAVSDGRRGDNSLVSSVGSTGVEDVIHVTGSAPHRLAKRAFKHSKPAHARARHSTTIASRAGASTARSASHLGGVTNAQAAQASARIANHSTLRGVQAASTRLSRIVAKVVARAATALTHSAGSAAAAGGAAAAWPVTLVAGAIVLLVCMVVGIGGAAAQSVMWATHASAQEGFIGDDYPWKGHYGGVNTQTNYYFGNCTDFAFWRVNRDMGHTDPSNWYYTHGSITPLGGNGGEWGWDGNMPGWTSVTSVAGALPGDIISYKPGVLGYHKVYGHVAYIAKTTPDGSLYIENYGGGHYFVTTFSSSLLDPLLASGAVVIKHSSMLDDYRRENTSLGGSSDLTSVKSQAQSMMSGYGWVDQVQFQCLDQLWTRESGWRWDAENPSSGAYGIPQSLPASKMASAGADWKTNPITQITWGLTYIHNRYGTPCGAWNHSEATGWY